MKELEKILSEPEKSFFIVKYPYCYFCNNTGLIHTDTLLSFCSCHWGKIEKVNSYSLIR